jgi:ribosomal protein S16
VVSIDRERVDHWVKNGALLSPTVSKLLRGLPPPAAKPAEPAAAQPSA